MSGRVRLAEGRVEWRLVDGEVVAFDTGARTFFAVNRTGGAVWQALVAGATMDELTSALAGRFGIPEARARGDAERFVAELDRRGLIVRSP